MPAIRNYNGVIKVNYKDLETVFSESNLNASDKGIFDKASKQADKATKALITSKVTVENLHDCKKNLQIEASILKVVFGKPITDKAYQKIKTVPALADIELRHYMEDKLVKGELKQVEMVINDKGILNHRLDLYRELRQSYTAANKDDILKALAEFDKAVDKLDKLESQPETTLAQIDEQKAAIAAAKEKWDTIKPAQEVAEISEAMSEYVKNNQALYDAQAEKISKVISVINTVISTKKAAAATETVDKAKARQKKFAEMYKNAISDNTGKGDKKY